jgi:hypothetical protein
MAEPPKVPPPAFLDYLGKLLLLRQRTETYLRWPGVEDECADPMEQVRLLLRETPGDGLDLKEFQTASANLRSGHPSKEEAVKQCQRLRDGVSDAVIRWTVPPEA